MVNLNDLSAETLLGIVEFLSLGDLAVIFEAFANTPGTIIPMISTTQAIKIIYFLIITGEGKPHLTIKTKGKVKATLPYDKSRRRLHRRKPDQEKGQHYRAYYPYLLMIEFERIFIPKDSSTAQMTLSATDLWYRTSTFLPTRDGAEPIHPISTRITFTAKHPFISCEIGDSLELSYENESGCCDGDIQDNYDSPTLIRTVGGNLTFKSAVWQRNDVRYEIPNSWMEMAGNIYVSVTLQQIVLLKNPRPEEWAPSPARLQKVMISFTDLALPTSRSLLRLLPQEVANMAIQEQS